MDARDENTGYLPDEATGAGQILIRKVEEAIYRHPGVAEVAAVFLPGMDSKHGLAAFIVPSDMSLTPQIIKHFVESSGHLSPGEFPQRYHMLPELPKTPSGKCQKHKLVQSLVGDW